MKTYLSLSLLFLSVIILNAQNGINSLELPNLDQPTPEVAALGKFTDIPVNMSTGTPNISIPLFSLKEMGLTSQVALAYHASGIKVNEIASRTGLGWSLVAGGMVSRQARGIADDDPNGFLNTTNTVANYYKESPEVRAALAQEAVLGLADYESDVYHFNVGDISGKFYFKQDGTIVDQHKNDFKITAIKEGIKISGWYITDTKGNTYTFGIVPNSSLKVHELKQIYYYTYPNLIPSKSTHHITAWHITRISDPFGNYIDFNYNTQNPNIDFWNLTGQNRVIHSTGKCSKTNAVTSFSHDNYNPIFLTSISSTKGEIQFEYNHNRIDLTNDKALTAVKLYNTNNNLVDHYDFEYDYFTSPNGIEVFAGISNSDQRTKRLYLKGITQKKDNDANQSYKFTYNQDHILPERFSYSQDFWGYFNGKNNDELYPSIIHRPYVSPVQVDGADRTVSLAYTKALILEEIKYPTKGKTRFIFESNTQDGGDNDFFVGNELRKEQIPNANATLQSSEYKEVTQNFSITEFTVAQYKFEIQRLDEQNNDCQAGSLHCPAIELYKNGQIYRTFYYTSPNSGYLDLYPANYTLKITNGIFGIPYYVSISLFRDVIDNNLNGDPIAVVGGLRVNEIQFLDYDNTILNRKKYKYRSFVDPSKSSGRSLNPPVFLSKNVPLFSANGQKCLQDNLSSNAIFPLNGQSGYHVTYTNVTEFNEGQENGKTEYTFSYTSDPQVNPSNVFESFGAVILPSEDYSHRRGNLENQKMYRYNSFGSTFSLVEVEQTNYIYTPSDPITIKNLLMSGFGTLYQADAYHNRSERYLLTKKTITNYYSSGNTIKTTHYNYDIGYDGRNFPINTITTNSDNTTKKINYTYPPEEHKLFTQNRISEPLETKTTVTTPNGSTVLSESTQKTIYKDWGNNLVLPEKVQTLKGEASEDNTLKDRMIYHDYDTHGNPLEVSKADGTNITYLWGYNQQYPIAKIENATLSEVASAIGLSITTIKTNGITNLSAINNIRVSLPNSMVTSYTYDPLIGVTSITDPRGYTTYYDYDDFNRLEFVKDQNGNILSQNEYNYRAQN